MGSKGEGWDEATAGGVGEDVGAGVGGRVLVALGAAEAVVMTRRRRRNGGGGFIVSEELRRV